MTRAGSAFCSPHPSSMLSRCGCAALGQSRILTAVYVLFVLVDIECLTRRAALPSCPVINEPVVSFLFNLRLFLSADEISELSAAVSPLSGPHQGPHQVQDALQVL